MKLRTMPDAAGTGQAVSLADLLGLPHGTRAWMVCICDVSASGQSETRIGGPSVSATDGLPLNSSSDSMVFPPVTDITYDLSEIYVYCPPSETLSVAILI